MKPSELLEDTIFTVSNFLSLFRILTVPVIVYHLYLEQATGDTVYRYYELAGVIVIIVSVFFDGFLARLTNQESRLGRFLDPLADKITSLIVGGFYCYYKGFPLWLYLAAVFRELAIVMAAIFLFLKRDVQVRPNIFGKLFAASMGFAAVVYTLELETVLYGITIKELSIAMIVVFYVMGLALYIKTCTRDWFEKSS